MSIAAQAYTIREAMAGDVPTSLGKLRDVGYERVELAGLHGLSAGAMRAALDGAGLVAVSAHEPWARVADDTERLVEDAAALGIADVVVPVMPAPWRDGGEAGYREFGALLAEKAAALAERRLRLHYHNHGYELVPFASGLGLDVLAAAAGSGVGLELDLAWLRGAGQDPAAWLARVPAERLRLVHVKDVVMRGDEALDTEVGAGIIEWEPVIAACRAAGIESYIVEQDRPGPDPFASLAVSLAKVRSLGVA